MLQPEKVRSAGKGHISAGFANEPEMTRPVVLPRVSVIIPAYNAQETLPRTLESLRAQSYRNWEAIIVDDGSSDDTAGVAEDYAGKDERIRFVMGLRMGVSIARNVGIGRARAEWILFLDADDVIVPEHLEKMLGEAEKDPACNIVICHWARIGPTGKTLHVATPTIHGDGFKVLARTCAFAIHACVLRRSVIEEVGKFDANLRTCEDWDLWQRIARAGAVFRTVPEVLAHYCVRQSSASMDGARMFNDALRVMERAYGADERVPRPVAAHANGLPKTELPEARLNWICWSAGLMIGQDQDPRSLLELVKDDQFSQLDPESVGSQIYEAALLPNCRGPEAWPELWPRFEKNIDGFFEAMEAQAGAKALARRSKDALAREILKHWNSKEPLTLGRGHAMTVEVTRPIADVHTHSSIERLWARVELNGEYLDTIELPVCDGLAAGKVIADAIAAGVGWTIVGAFLRENVYSKVLARSGAHDQVGWLTLLQELWGRPDWDNGKFYKAEETAVGSFVHVEEPWHAVEISAELTGIETRRSEVEVVLTVGGSALGSVNIEITDGRISAHELMARLNKWAGLELCRVAVREAILGRVLVDGTSLRERLAEAAKQHAGGRAAHAVEGVSFAPGSERSWASALAESQHVVALARRPGEMRAAQFAVLPSAAMSEIVAMARATQEPVVELSADSKAANPTRLIYSPDLLWRAEGMKRTAAAEEAAPAPSRTRRFGRGYFELLHAKANEAAQLSEYERRKREQMLSLVPAGIKRALEIGCGDGGVTELLAPRIGQLLATDISRVAVDRAGQRCAGLGNVEFRQLDIGRDALGGPFDLIVCSEVLYYLDDVEALRRAIGRMVEALTPDGALLVAHANLVVDETEQPGFDWDLPFGAKGIGEALGGNLRLRRLKEIETPLYRIQLWRRQSLLRSLLLPPRVSVREAECGKPAESEGRAILWSGGKPKPTPQAVVATERLPILMYHRVSPVGSAKMRRWRVTPEQFEQQLKFLRDDGYRSVTFGQWRTAAQTRRAIPGRAVILTFDDGYQDFYDYAWPLLKKYGFGAYVFLVADRIGKTNEWDLEYGEESFLLPWDAVRRLKKEGVRFGSHTATHPQLATMSNADVVREAARSREILARELGQTVNSFAYPYGSFDSAVAHLVGACGYEFALTCRPWTAAFTDPLLQLPRVEVFGDRGFDKFVASVNVES